MEFLLLGATGTLGRSISDELVRRGHRTRAASRTKRSRVNDLVRWVRLDVTSGAGLEPAVEGVDAVIDAANSRSLRRSALDALLVDGTSRVLQACHSTGDVHYVGVSIVGIEPIPTGYYRAKLRQERVIEEGPAPWSLLRATQFHDLLDQLLTAAARLPVLLLPTATKLQPVDVADVAQRMASAAEGPAGRRLPDIGGPRVQPLGDLAHDWMRARGRTRPLLRLPLPGRVGHALADGALCAERGAVDGRDFTQWLAASAGT